MQDKSLKCLPNHQEWLKAIVIVLVLNASHYILILEILYII